mmetsp:Transcript_19002/g.31079  ORF Transcript_19002/g.31079 Transcript_19002/m.31079 type:complete len:544 (-) Transcript_19002:228-1859(-)|eukprot:CAMPEP_0203758084 /NCGR_PEP_ID=MMETSP0098-20131031/10839_1 /ASSEMBLY_ACC=CAM_ASM_000208 /TAXON_ID=96639 /ORGANISM=" , Strain NY0313808BC1" /LENGTH=543 /DNA_ID=CAMNT_0050650331 /DNA_START=111 /DNA_END=1742 /DNA_ORIENTATION=+
MKNVDGERVKMDMEKSKKKKSKEKKNKNVDEDEERKKRKKEKKEKRRLERAAAEQAAEKKSKKKEKKEKKRAREQGEENGVTKKSKSNGQVTTVMSKEEFLKVNDITVEGNNVPDPYTTFDQARQGFDDVALPTLNACCSTFEKPSPIQGASWPIVLGGSDMVGVAATGSGKTLAFLLPGVSKMLRGDYGKGASAKPRMLVLAPTRELAMQSAKVAQEACNACETLSAIVVFGGQPKWEQRKQIQQCATLDILVATPGRLLDFVQDQVVDLSNVHYLVLDEADRMLDMGFEKDVKRIIAMTVPMEKRQTVMFSATWPPAIRELAHTFMNKPTKIVVGSDKLSASASVTQHVEVLEPMAKERRLLQLLRKVHNGSNRIIVFALYKKEAARIENTLSRNNFKVAGIHGDKAQSAREEAVRMFDEGKLPILVATDVASRGLDIKGVEYVINVSFPLTVEDYVHRIGRTGRAGAKGIAYTFFTAHDKHLAGALQNVLRQAGEEVPAELAKFGNTVKKKEHKLYGSHFKQDDGPIKSATHVTFDSDDE